MIEKKAPAFTDLSEFCSTSAGGKVVFSTDDFFAPCENMLLDTEPIFIPEKYTEFGKWMDGWETRRKRVTGHDWCILKLATKCVIREEALAPERDTKMGSACTDCEYEQIERLSSDKWETIVPVTALRPGYEETRLNYQKVVSDEAWTHIRVNMFPDGGIARLRVYGEARPEPPSSDEIVDLVSLLSGGTCQGYSNAHFGHPRNMIKPCKSKCMADGWETARRLDRPEIIEANDDGTLKLPGQEWAILKLGFPGTIQKICVDTAHFKGNYPDSVKIEGAYLGCADWSPDSTYTWSTVLKASKLSAHNEHWFDCHSEPITHIRVSMAPDGGISRIRTFGFIVRSD
ncbi:allantoicase-like isoform X2 [Ostrinia furnacalis]|uniref:allantoicase-like isoform X2 n=1 Tax=Ostrinia furnacalis TaxID=93504 RepID=UPI00103FD9FA|nr:allantoicase-like isoform X2 [Ostrinia furnacalis]